MLKGGLRLVRVPTTLLAAVDSSLGGKGAVDVTVRGRVVKNPVGVFHYAEETWLCPELYASLSDTQRREGALEAWKMVASLDAELFQSYTRRAPALERLVKDARRLKESVCAQDPYEQQGLRRGATFGHTFGHVLESVSRFKLSHGDAVGLGMRCALDVGRALGVTPPNVAERVEAALEKGPGVLGRERTAALLGRAALKDIQVLLAADKKTGAGGELRMVLLTDIGVAEVRDVSAHDDVHDRAACRSESAPPLRPHAAHLQVGRAAGAGARAPHGRLAAAGPPERARGIPPRGRARAAPGHRGAAPAARAHAGRGLRGWRSPLPHPRHPLPRHTPNPP